jgi:thiol-disulfide isomerase/thioredoxin
MTLSAIGMVAWLAAFVPATAAPADSPANDTAASLQVSTEAEKPPFLLDNLHGEPSALQAFKGNVVLVHFFATWCEPCVRELTSLQKLAATTRGKPLAIVAIDVAEVDLRVRAFFEKIPVDFAVLLDRDRAVSKAWGVSALPTTFVLDANLAPKLFVEGDLDWSHPDILTTLEALYPTETSNDSSHPVRLPIRITTQSITHPLKETPK